jgi:DNA-binding LacI/PurR family transcriptional regulator
MAKLSMEMLISQIKDGAEARHIFVPFSLWQRESTAFIE